MGLKFHSLFLITGTFLVIGACSHKEAPKSVILEVPVVKVLVQDVPLESEYTGQTFGAQDIQIAPRVKGLVETINFKEGSFVTKGQLLYTIEPLTYQNNVNIAQANQAEAKTNLAAAKSDYERIESLVKINAVSQREFEAAKAKFEAAKGKVSSADAQLRNAQIDLGYCNVTAPISGIIGISKYQVGDYVSPGPFSSLNTISSTDVIRVRFTLSEQEFLKLYREKMKENSSLQGGNDMHLKLSDGSDYPIAGSYSFANREVDPSTGAIVLEAKFANPDQLLRPGQYVKILVAAMLRSKALVIPQRSVIEMQGIYQVYLLGDSSKVNLTIVQPGPVYKDSYIIEDGLKEGDQIAMGGTQLLRNGSVITPKLTEWQPGLAVQKKSTTK